MHRGYVAELDIEVPMRDGTVLRADVYRPPGDGPWPVLLTRTPYDKAVALDPSRGPDERLATAAGYVMARQDVRGRHASEGRFVPFEAEADDGYDTVEWVADQAWCDGNVGMFGASYVGYAQWMAAARRPPHLRAIAPMVATSDLHDHWVYEGGVAALWFDRSWLISSLAADMIEKAAPGDHDRRQRLVKAIDGLAEQLPMTPGEVDAVLEDLGLHGIYRTWLDHPTRDDYWKALSPRESWSTIQVPALNVAGWYDVFIGGSLANYVGMSAMGGSPEAREGQRLIVGPWRHAHPLLADPVGDAVFGLESGGASLGMAAIHVRFFDRWLKGATAAMTDAPVRLFVMGTNVWRDADDWPLPDAAPVAWYLRSGGHANSLRGDGALSTEPPPDDEPADAFLSDPSDPVPTRGGNLCCWQTAFEPGAFDQRAVEERDDVLVYTSPPLDSDLEVIGPVSLSVFVRSTAPDFDVTAKLVDVAPDGRARNLCEGIRRARFRQGTHRADPVPSGEVAEVVVDLLGTANVFMEGHRVRLEVAASNWPRFERHPQTADGAGMQAARQTVFHDRIRPSHLALPVVPTTAPRG